MRVATIVGNRPQFVKAAAVSRRLREQHEEILVHTGQHYDDDLSRIFFEELHIPAPAHQLHLGTGSNAAQTGRMISALDELFEEINPDVTLVYGDTNTTLAGAIVSAQRHVPVAHIEAGMRSFDRSMPEEFNRVLTDHASDILICSTEVAATNLRNEGVDREIHVVGDVMADVVLTFLPIAKQRSTIIEDQGLTPGEFFLITAHRAGNVDDPARLEQLVEVLESLPMRAVFPVHPRTHKQLHATGLIHRLEDAANMTLLPPIGYLDLVRLADGAAAVLTDSGGLQKEAYVLKTKCVTLRETTEWVETVGSGWNTLVGLDRASALRAIDAPVPDAHPDLYGAGHAADRTCTALDEALARLAG